MPKVGPKQEPSVRLPEDVPLPGVPDEPLEAVAGVLEPLAAPPGVTTVAGPAEVTACIQALHGDEVALGFVHANGSMCACRYLVGVVLGAAGLTLEG